MAVVEQKWCLGGNVLPLENKTLDVFDMTVEDKMQQCLAEHGPCMVLSLKSTGHVMWLEKYLGKPYRWWKAACRRVPLVKEILHELKGQRAKGLCTSKMLLHIWVRGQKIGVLNHSGTLSLALQCKDPKFENLVWFLEEVKKDQIQELDEALEGFASSKESGVDEESAIIEDCLENLRMHANCHRAWFLDCQKALGVVKKGQGMKRQKFIVQGMRKRHREALVSNDPEAWEALRLAVDASVKKALAFLDNGSLAPALENHEAPQAETQDD